MPGRGVRARYWQGARTWRATWLFWRRTRPGRWKRAALRNLWSTSLAAGGQDALCCSAGTGSCWASSLWRTPSGRPAGRLSSASSEMGLACGDAHRRQPASPPRPSAQELGIEQAIADVLPTEKEACMPRPSGGGAQGGHGGGRHQRRPRA